MTDKKMTFTDSAPFEEQNFLAVLHLLGPIDTVVLHGNGKRRVFSLGMSTKGPARRDDVMPREVVWKGRVTVSRSVPQRDQDAIWEALQRSASIFGWDPRSDVRLDSYRHKPMIRDKASYVRSEIGSMPRRWHRKGGKYIVRKAMAV